MLGLLLLVPIITIVFIAVPLQVTLGRTSSKQTFQTWKDEGSKCNLLFNSTTQVVRFEPDLSGFTVQVTEKSKMASDVKRMVN